MQDSKLHILLSKLSIYELNRFAKFIASPYHNEDKKLIKLYDYLSLYYKRVNKELPDKQQIWNSVHTNKPFTNLQFARLLSDLLKKLESFMVVERTKNNHIDRCYFLLETYNTLGLEKHFTEPYQHVLKMLEQQPYRDSDYYFHTFRLNAQQNIFLENRKQRTTEKNLIETVGSLDIYYFINKLRYSAAILHYKQFLNLDEEFVLLSGLLTYLKEQPVNIPIVDIYRHVVLTLIEPDDERHFVQLKQLLFAHANILQINVQKEVLAFALNYCIRKINKGDAAYQPEIFELYKNALQNKLLLENDVLTPWDYKNIITIGLRNKGYQWIDTFMEKYIHKLPVDEQHNAYTFNRARYYFSIGEYDNVLQLLQNVEYNDIFYLLDSKITLMKTYYELGEYQPLLSLKESFRILLRRKKTMSVQNQVNYGNFVRLIMKLFRADVKNKVQMATLKKEIETTQNIADKSWITEKLAELSGKRRKL